MEKIKIIVDSCADLSKELLEKYDIDYARMNTVYGGKETPASLTWEYYSPQELYNIMRNGERVTTTQVPATEFRRIFKAYLDNGYDSIIYIGCSSKQSGSVNTGAIVAKEVLADYKDKKIYCIDSLNASIGEGMLGIYATELVNEGKSAEEINDIILKSRNFINEYVTVHTLDFLKKAGRVKGSAAFFGNLFGIKPIIISDIDGYQTPIKKVKGRNNSITEVVNLLESAIDENAKIYVCHADCNQDELGLMYDLLKTRFPKREIITVYIGPIIGASVGPDAIGVYAFGKEVTYSVDAAK